MPNKEETTRRNFARPSAYLMVAVAATAANLALWAVGFQYTIATGMLVGASCAGVVCWRQALTEQRTLDHLGAMAADMWWHGYATCIEDVAGDGPARTVVPFRRGDRYGDSRRDVNGSETL